MHRKFPHKRLFNLFLTANLMAAVCVSGWPAFAQQSPAGEQHANPRRTDAPTEHRSFASRLPRNARIGSTPERRAAWERLTPEQREELLARFRAHITPALERAAAQQRQPQNTQARQQQNGSAFQHTWRQIIAGDNAPRGRAAAAPPPGPLGFTGFGNRRFLVRPVNPNPGRNGAGQHQAGDGSVTTLRAPDNYYDPCYPMSYDYPAYPCEPDPCYSYSCYPTNQPPQVSLTATPTSGTAPLTVSFNANAYDPDGYIVDYFWIFGDGQTAAGASVSHTYSAPGNFTAVVIVTDNYGDTASAAVTIQVLGGPPPPSGADADADGLADDFEQQVADAFTPFYHVSAGEPDGFARFGDFVPQTPVQVFAPVPPLSHFRVQPLGFATDRYGTLLSVLRIDYLTLWNHDSGLDVGGDCTFYLSVLGGLVGFSASQILDGMGPHQLDNERAAVLVAAPVSNYTFNTNPWAYSAYSFYTAAHEGTFTDQSSYYNPWQPVPAGLHLNLWLSRSKHATYTFNPDHYPVMPWYLIFATYATIDFLYFVGYISFWEYLVYLYIADATFFSCVVERFHEQGGAYAATRINVGEPGLPLNGSSFIQDNRLLPKLTVPLW